jgi:hypothetical protein
VFPPLPDRADKVLASVNFGRISDKIPGFKDWPAVRKIETAYLSAVAAGGPAEGTKFLTVATGIIAEDHSNAVLYEAALKPFVPKSGQAKTVVDRSSVRFSDFKSTSAGSTNLEVSNAILAMEKYVDRVPGGMQSGMRVCCNLKDADIYDILRSSESRFRAMERAVIIGRLPPELRDRLLKLLANIAENSHAMSYEPDLKPFFDTLKTQSTDAQPGIFVPNSANTSTTSWTSEDGVKTRDIVRDAAQRAGLSEKAITGTMALLGPPAASSG